MILRKDQKFYKAQIRNCERNIEFVQKSNFSDQEKKDLMESYRNQIKSHKQKLMSFYQPHN